MRVANLSRAKVRARFDNRFTIDRVAEDYLSIYCALPGVRRVTRRITAPHRAHFPLSAGWGRKPISHPGLQRLGPPQTAPAEYGSVYRQDFDCGRTVEHVYDDAAVGARHGNVDLARGQP
jgi:hypothetical protein